MVRNAHSLLMVILLLTFCQIKNKIRSEKIFLQNDIPEYEGDKDPATNYNQYYFENSLEIFSNSVFGFKKIPNELGKCLIANKLSAAKSARKFLQSYNGLVDSINYAKLNNKSVKIDTEEECIYKLNQDWTESGDQSNTHIRSIYIVSKRYFLELFRSQFFSDFLKYMFCMQEIPEYKKFFKLWRVLNYEHTYDRLFGNFCTISNIFHFLGKRINEKVVENPFDYLGETLGNLFDKISSHLVNIALSYNLDKN
jgi:flagellin-specific chaperone FliS